jgi:hypothetical protein
MQVPEIPRDELHAAVRARDELDRELEPHVIDAFLDRVERTIDARVDARIEARMRAHMPERSRGGAGMSSFWTVTLALGSMGMGIGAIGASSALGGAFGPVVGITAWIAIAAINLAHVSRR